MASTKKTKKSTTADFKKLKLLICVVNREKSEFYLDFLSGFEINFQTVLLGEGTAKSEVQHLLGLENSHRSVILSVIREDKSEAALQGLEDKFHSVRGGKGIAFTIPLSSVIGVALYSFLSNNRQGVKGEIL